MDSITCFGGVGEATGSNFLFETKNRRILIDCGVVQGVSGSHEMNSRSFEYDPSTVDVLFITHAHIDHIGRVPKLVKDGFSGPIYSTGATRDIAELMFQDMVKIGERNARNGEIPLYGAGDVEKTLRQWKTLEYHKDLEVKIQSRDPIQVRLYDSGHILGACMYKFSVGEKSIMFTGDIGNSPSPILRSTEEVSGIDYLLMESVYGDRNHEDKEERDEKFKSAILEIIERKGALLIPAFSLERTQVLLFILDNLFESKEIPAIPVFLDSPLAIRVTEVYERIEKHYNADARKEISGGDDIFKFPKLVKTANVRDSKEIDHTQGPKIIIAGSGMSTAGRIVNHEKHYLPDSKNMLLLVGYQAPGTLGRELAEGKKRVFIDEDSVRVRATVRQINGFSAHADSNQLVGFVSNTASSLKQVFVAMGEPRSSIFLAQRLRDELGVNALMPERKKKYILDL